MFNCAAVKTHSAARLVGIGLLASVLLPLGAEKASAAIPTINFPSSPLYLNTGVAPNVMLMLDDSGSMNNIMWETAYNPNTDYSNGGSYKDWSAVGAVWPLNASFVLYSALTNTSPSSSYYTSSLGGPSMSCVSGYTIGINKNVSTFTFKCLKLPDPVGSGATQYTPNYLNYLFNTYGTANSSSTSAGSAIKSDLTATIPNTYRLQVAQTVSDSIVDANYTSIRFCLSTLDTTTVLDVLDYCALLSASGGGSGTKNKFEADIDALVSHSETPLAEAYYEITRYFRGLTPFYRAGNNYGDGGSPSAPNQGQYRCQKNFVIYVTDGYPTLDNTFPTTTSQEPNLVNSSTGTSLPDYDGLHPITNPPSAAINPFPQNVPQFSDGYYNNCGAYTLCNSTQEGYTLYLDDLALFGYKLNISLSGNDPAGKPYSDPAFQPRNIETFAIGLSTNNQMMEDAASYGNTGYSYQANNVSQLTAALQSALTIAQATAASSAAVSASAGSISANSLLFQATYETKSWTGDVWPYALASPTNALCTSGPSVPVGTLCPLSWDFDTTNAHFHTTSASNGYTKRKVYTYDFATHTALAFNWAALSANTNLAAILNTNPDTLVTDTLGQARANFILGDPTNEISTSGGTMRARPEILGDIINSAPFYVGPPSSDYADNSYVTFQQSNSTRIPMLYVGGNDGMLHGFQADTTGQGAELFAYVPGPVWGKNPSATAGFSTFPQLTKLTSTTYNSSHVYMVDGPITSADAKIGSSWKTVLVGALGTGGRGVYALDVTDPTSFNASKVLWEFTSSDDPDLGYTLGQAAIVKTADGKWSAIVSSGYNNASGIPCVFILNLDHTGSTWTKGTDYYKIVLNGPSNGNSTSTVPNGAATPAAVDKDRNGVIDTLYVGDLFGNMWKVDVSSSALMTTLGGASGTGLTIPLFSTGAAGQAITARPEVGYNQLTPTSVTDTVVYFGTGRYMDTTDPTTTTAQYFFGVFDTTSTNPASAIAPSSLLTQTITTSGSYRTVTNNTLNPATYSGFKLALPTSKERQITNSLLLDGRIYFTTLIPSNTDPCLTNATGWLMELSAINGGQIPQQPLFDTNNDGKIDGSDTTASGLYSSNGALSTPSVVDLGDGTQKVMAGSTSGTLFSTLQKSGARLGRVNWHELTP